MSRRQTIIIYPISFHFADIKSQGSYVFHLKRKVNFEMSSSNERTYNLTTLRDEEFQEDDIWGSNIVNDKNEIGSKFSTTKGPASSNMNMKRLATAAKMIPKSNKNNTMQEFKIVQHSAPVKIPDWSKIYGTSLKKDGFVTNNNSWGSDEEAEVGDDEGNMMPPHEWLAKRLGRNQISSFSVCEGVGRTLKGRDLSRVRNAVLTRTGFLE